MKLQRMRIEQLRQFRKPFVLENLQPGLNLIHGPNESGKSTLVRAIRAAFFERYRSTAVDDLRPWGGLRRGAHHRAGFRARQPCLASHQKLPATQTVRPGCRHRDLQ